VASRVPCTSNVSPTFSTHALHFSISLTSQHWTQSDWYQKLGKILHNQYKISDVKSIVNRYHFDDFKKMKLEDKQRAFREKSINISFLDFMMCV
jgi:hypothetical protein